MERRRRHATSWVALARAVAGKRLAGRLAGSLARWQGLTGVGLASKHAHRHCAFSHLLSSSTPFKRLHMPKCISSHLRVPLRPAPLEFLRHWSTLSHRTTFPVPRFTSNFSWPPARPKMKVRVKAGPTLKWPLGGPEGSSGGALTRRPCQADRRVQADRNRVRGVPHAWHTRSRHDLRQCSQSQRNFGVSQVGPAPPGTAKAEAGGRTTSDGDGDRARRASPPTSSACGRGAVRGRRV